MAAVSAGSDLQHRGSLRGHPRGPGGVADGGPGCPANPSPTDVYSVLDQLSESYSYLVRRADEQAFLDKMRDSFGQSAGLSCNGVPPELKPRTVLLEGATVESLAALGPDDGCGLAGTV
jgi:hypothetical protein